MKPYVRNGNTKQESALAYHKIEKAWFISGRSHSKMGKAKADKPRRIKPTFEIIIEEEVAWI